MYVCMYMYFLVSRNEIKNMFPFPFARRRADSRRFSRADLILQGLLASCAADGSEGFTDPPSDGVNDYSRTYRYFFFPLLCF